MRRARLRRARLRGKVAAGAAAAGGRPHASEAAGATRGLTVPIVTRLDGPEASGISLVLASPSSADDTAHATLTVSGSPGAASFVFTRRWLSVGGNARPLNLAGTWMSHAGCWRPALGAFFELHPEVAQPDSRTLEALPSLEGSAAYAYYFAAMGGWFVPTARYFDVSFEHPDQVDLRRHGTLPDEEAAQKIAEHFGEFMTFILQSQSLMSAMTQQTLSIQQGLDQVEPRGLQDPMYKP